MQEQLETTLRESRRCKFDQTRIQRRNPKQGDAMTRSYSSELVDGLKSTCDVARTNSRRRVRDGASTRPAKVGLRIGIRLQICVRHPVSIQVALAVGRQREKPTITRASTTCRLLAR